MLLAGEVDAREGLVERDRDVGVRLVVAQADVEDGPVALDEVLLGQQRLGLGLGGDEVDLVDRGDHVRRAAARGRLAEVRGHALADRARLAHVEHLALGVLEQVDARARRAGPCAARRCARRGWRSSVAISLRGYEGVAAVSWLVRHRISRRAGQSPRWSEIEAEAPELATRARRASSTLTCTRRWPRLRRDGSPRISGTEIQFEDGEIWFGSMWRAVEGARPPARSRASPCTAARTARRTGKGTRRSRGRAEEVDDDERKAALGSDRQTEPWHLFRADIAELVVVGLNDARDKLVVESWHEGRGLSLAARALDQRAADAVGHAAGLLGALDLDGPALHDLPPAAAHVVDRDRSRRSPGRASRPAPAPGSAPCSSRSSRPSLKPPDCTRSRRRPSIIDSVRLPWATVVPNGLSFLARSTSTWIHWSSPESSANGVDHLLA